MLCPISHFQTLSLSFFATLTFSLSPLEFLEQSLRVLNGSTCWSVLINKFACYPAVKSSTIGYLRIITTLGLRQEIKGLCFMNPVPLCTIFCQCIGRETSSLRVIGHGQLN